MKKYLIPALIILHAIGASPAIGQDQDPYEIIQNMKNKMDEIHDYSADVEIEVDVDFIKMPIKHATLFYKKPDKIKFKSDEFIMLPKRGLNSNITELLSEPYTAIYLQEESINNQLFHVIRIVPMGKKPDIILATWWVNSQNFRLAKSESNTRKDGSFTIRFIYNNDEMIMPSEMVFSFEVEKLGIPLKFIGKSSGMEIDKDKMDQVSEGRVYIRFSNYKINTNLEDEIFQEKEDGTNNN